jgi:1-acyl-sn-glycerol-3-phosphate acyltransferase
MQNTFGVAGGDDFRIESVGGKQPIGCYVGSAHSEQHDADPFEWLGDQLERCKQGRERDRCGTLLIVVRTIVPAGFLLGWLAVMTLPRLTWRWAALRGLARAALAALRVPVSVSGIDRIPRGGAVLAFNHASYVDALVLAAVLPGEPVYVVKKELASQVFAGPLLRRLGVLFLERFELADSLADLESVAAAARQERVLVFFPEGTFTRRAGLSGFYLGAFRIAAQAGLPVTPGILRGTRSMLRSGQWVPALERDQRRHRRSHSTLRQRSRLAGAAARRRTRGDLGRLRGARSGRADQADSTSCRNDEMTRGEGGGPGTVPAKHLARLSPNVAVLGIVSLLMGMSSAMIYGLLPVFLVTVLGATATTVGLIEGIAEATTSAMKIFSGAASDWIGRRKPLVVLGYALSAVNKLLFPLAEAASTVLMARIADRIGKGMRDAPRDALLADVTPSAIRGSGFGLRFAL